MGDEPGHLWEFSFHGPLRIDPLLTTDEFQAIFDAAPDGCIVVRGDGTIRVANRRMAELFGWRREEFVGMSVETLLPEALRARHERHRADFLERPHTRPMGAGLDLRGRRRDGSEFPVEVSLSPWTDARGEVQVICCVRDVQSVRRLQSFSEGALRATEDERKRIARELHDDTAQRLATLILRARQLAFESDAAARHALFEEVREEIVDAADEVRRMARGLRPPELEELGLGHALQAHVRTLREAGALDVEADIQVVGAGVGATTALALYRIVQEALSNARRHSGARKASLRVFRDGDDVVAEVSDPGRGFDLAATMDGQRGLGLIGMQERATMVGGRVAFDSEPGAGTRVRVTVPVTTE